MSTVRIQTPPGVPPVPPAARRPAGRRSIVELEGLDGAISLAKLLDALHHSGRRLPVHVAVYITHELARALRHVHDAVDRQGRVLGRVHGSVNPHNVLLLRSGRVKLLARSALPSSGDRQADLFMLGLAAWEMLVGWPLADAGPSARGRAAPVAPSALRPGLPDAVDAVVMRALDRGPRRYPSAGSLAGETARFLATRPDPRRSLRVLLHEVLDGDGEDGTSVTRLTRVPWRDGSGALPPLPPPPPSIPPPAPSAPSTREPVFTFSVETREPAQPRRWLGRLGILLFQAAVAAILAWAALHLLDFGRRADPPAPAAQPSRGTIIVPMPERSPVVQPPVIIHVDRHRHHRRR
jgi:hypothetical protein